MSTRAKRSAANRAAHAVKRAELEEQWALAAAEKQADRKRRHDDNRAAWWARYGMATPGIEQIEQVETSNRVVMPCEIEKQSREDQTMNSINYNDELKAAIKAATLFTYDKNDRPALNCVLISATADSVRVYATDSFTAFRYTCSNDGGGQFTALLSAADAKALASVKLQANALYNLAVENGTLKLTHFDAVINVFVLQTFTYPGADNLDRLINDADNATPGVACFNAVYIERACKAVRLIAPKKEKRAAFTLSPDKPSLVKCVCDRSVAQMLVMPVRQI